MHAAGVQVTLVDANHCPGAVQFLFELPDGRRYVHTGDMRFAPSLLTCAPLQRFHNPDILYLDTTYSNPKYTFPPQVGIAEMYNGIDTCVRTTHAVPQQEESVDYVVNTIRDLLPTANTPRRLFLIQTYVIGKERILIQIHKQLGLKIYVSQRKLGIFQCLDWPEDVQLDAMFTRDPNASCVHITPWEHLGESWPYFRPNFVNMERAQEDCGVDEV